MAIHNRIHHDFSIFFWLLASGSRTMTSGPLLTKFSTLATASNYGTDYNYAK